MEDNRIHPLWRHVDHLSFCVRVHIICCIMVVKGVRWMVGGWMDRWMNGWSDILTHDKDSQGHAG